MTSARRVTWMLVAATVGVGAGGATAASIAHASPEAPSATTQRHPVPISARDRVYTADQSSNTVSVIDPSTDRTLGTIALGDERLGRTFSPQYGGDTGVHGLAISPNQRRLAVVSVTSNTVHIIDTATNKVLNTTDVGRAAHEGSFTADGKQFWVANRGRDTISVVDAVHGGLITNVRVGDGPSKVLMSPDGRTAYVNHTSKAEVTVIDVGSRRVTGHITGLGATFSSDQAISPDGKRIWVSHKQDGKVSVLDLQRNRVLTVLNTGPDTNHPQFVDTREGKFVYVTMGGLDQTWVYRRTAHGAPVLVTKIANHGHAPHGAWPSGDGTRMYVGLEKSDGVDVIDTRTRRVVDTIASGQEPQAIVYASRAAHPGSTQGLGHQGLDQQAHNVPTTLPDGSAGDPIDPVQGRTLEATIRPVGGLDMIQLQARGLKPDTVYQAYSVSADGRRTAVLSFPTDAKGRAPMALAFGAFDGKRIAIKIKGEATPVQKAAYAEAAAGKAHSHSTSTADLIFCDCC